MKKNIRKTISSLIFIVLLSLISVIFAINKNISLLGGDWGNPNTAIQINTFLTSNSYLWSNSGNLFGFQQSFLTNYPILLIAKFISLLHYYNLSFTLLIIALLMLFFNQYIFLRYLKLNQTGSIIGSLLLMLSPLTFNYILMGWIYVLISLSLFPLIMMSFIESVKKEKHSYTLITGILFAIALVQSQSMFWIPIILIATIPILINSKREFYLYIKSFIFTVFIALLLHFYWILPQLINIDPGIIGNNIVKSSGSIGSSVKMTLVNSLKLWGGLFNYQYEQSYPSSLISLSFIPTVIMIYTIAIKKRLKKNKILLVFGLIFLITPILHLVPRDLLSKMPFANVIRDTSRFTVLSAFAYSSIVAIFINNLKTKSKKQIKLLIIILIILSSTLPFWIGGLWQKPRADEDFRFRKFNEPKAYSNIETELSKENLDVKAIYIPIGGSFGYINDESFYGPYKEIRDSWAGYSPVPGVITFSDKSQSNIGNTLFLNSITNNSNSLNNISHLLNAKYLVIRKNTWPYFREIKNLENQIKTNNDWQVIIDNEDEIIFKSDSYLPHIYIPKKIVKTKDTNNDLENILDITNEEPRTAYYFINNKKTNNTTINDSDEFYIKAKQIENTYNKNISYHEDIIIPTVNNKPFTLRWRMVILKESYQLWKTNKSPIEQVNLLNWFAMKRLVEINRYALSKEEKSKIMDDYYNKTNKAIQIIETSKSKYEDTDELETYWQTANDLLIYIENTYLFSKLDTTTKNKIKQIGDEYRSWLQINTQQLYSTCCYEIETTNNNKFNILLDKKTFSKYKQTELFLNIKTLNNSNEIEGEKTIPINLEKKMNDWYETTSIKLNSNKKYIINIKGTDNENLLTDKNWLDTTKTEANQNTITTNSNILDISPQYTMQYREISNWKPNAEYKVSFDYLVSKANLGIAIGEVSTSFEDIYKNNAANIKLDLANVDNNTLPKKISIRLNKRLNNNSDQFFENQSFIHFEQTIKSSHDASKAYLYAYVLSEKNTISSSELKNIKIEEVVNPIIILEQITNDKQHSEIPQIEFSKINPTKYKIKVSKVTDDYNLIFNESFNPGWKLYLNSEKPENQKNIMYQIGRLARTITTPFIKNDNGYNKILGSYFNNEINEGIHKNIFLEPDTFETWGQQTLANNSHQIVNGYANSWYITKDQTNNMEEYELILEFKPQQYFYIGLLISIITLLYSIIYIVIEILLKKTIKHKIDNLIISKFEKIAIKTPIKNIYCFIFNKHLILINRYKNYIFSIFILGFFINIYMYKQINFIIDILLLLFYINILIIKKLKYKTSGKFALILTITLPIWIMIGKNTIAEKTALWIYILFTIVLIQQIYFYHKKKN